MKISAHEEVVFQASKVKSKRKFTVSFTRFGKKDAKYTKEHFGISAKSEITGNVYFINALQLEDIKNIYDEAKKLLKKANLKAI